MTNPADTLNDPNVRVPAAVRAAAERADAFHTAAHTEQPEPEPQPAAEQTFTQQVTEPQPATPPAQGEQPQDFQRMYAGLKGRFDQLMKTNKALSEQVGTLQSTIASLHDQMQAQAAAPEMQASRLLSDREREEFGDEFLSVVGKKAKEELSPEVAQLKSQVAQLQGQVAQVTGHVVQDARSKMYEQLGQALPNWRDVNRNPDFVNWLGLQDAFSGAIRHNMLKDAFERNDTHRVLAFFNGFLAEEAAVSPARDEPQPEPAQGKVPLETFAAPGRAKSAATPGPSEKPVVTRAEISRHYADAAAGKYIGRDAEYAKAEARIQQAVREGRVR